MQWLKHFFARLVSNKSPNEQQTELEESSRLTPGQLSRCQALLGTYVEVHLKDPTEQIEDTALIAISQAAYKAIEHIQTLMSFHDPRSKLSRINASAHIAPLPLTPELTDVLRQALTLSRLSDGHFDITVAPQLIAQGLLPEHRSKAEQQTPVRGSWRDIELTESSGRHWVFFKRPLQLDLGGIAKGYAVDQAMAAAEAMAQKNLGADHALQITINAGGDLSSNHWQDMDVSLRHPADPQQLLSVVMQNRALASSAGYFTESMNESLYGLSESSPVESALSAIIAPHTREPLILQHSVSVFADNCMLADALTKIALLHPHADTLVPQLGGQVVRIDRHGQITQSPVASVTDTDLKNRP